MAGHEKLEGCGLTLRSRADSPFLTRIGKRAALLIAMTQYGRYRLSRRRLLAGASGLLGIGALGFVEQLAGLSLGRAQAQAGGVKRLVLFFSPNGTVHRHWRPSGEGTSYAFPAGSILEPLTGLERELIVLDGIDFKGVSNHEGGMAAMLTGGGADTVSQGQSVDQFIASQLPPESPFSSLELGVGTDAWGAGVQTRMLYSAGHDFVHPDQDPVNVYKRVFGAIAGEPAEVDANMRRKKSVLDVLRSELKALRNRVGAHEHAKLDAHLEALRRMEGGVMGTAGACDAAAPVMQLDPNDHKNFADITRAQTDLLVSALACGMTRVASLQLSHTVGPHVFSWLGLSEGHHSLSHMDDSNTAGVADFVKAERWLSEQFRYLVDQLALLPEPGADGSLLDHTLLVWVKELADGRLHDNNSVPFVIAGGGAALQRGRYLKLGGEPHQKLLVTLCQAMGLATEEFGETQHGTGVLPGVLA